MTDETSDIEALKTLARKLADPRMPVQNRIAAEAGVPQGMVSLALNGKLRRVTTRVRYLIEYSNSRVPDRPSVESRSAGRSAIKATTETGAAPADRARLAEGDLRDYLDDGFDPEIVIAQLDLLRRVQRTRKPGPRPRRDTAGTG